MIAHQKQLQSKLYSASIFITLLIIKLTTGWILVTRRVCGSHLTVDLQPGQWEPCKRLWNKTGRERCRKRETVKSR